MPERVTTGSEPRSDRGRYVVPTCDCIHGQDYHDPATGACLVINPTYGPCPCAATQTWIRDVLEAVHRYQRVEVVEPGHDEQTEACPMCGAESAWKPHEGSGAVIAGVKLDERWCTDCGYVEVVKMPDTVSREYHLRRRPFG